MRKAAFIAAFLFLPYTNNLIYSRFIVFWLIFIALLA